MLSFEIDITGRWSVKFLLAEMLDPLNAMHKIIFGSLTLLLKPFLTCWVIVIWRIYARLLSF